MVNLEALFKNLDRSSINHCTACYQVLGAGRSQIDNTVRPVPPPNAFLLCPDCGHLMRVNVAGQVRDFSPQDKEDLLHYEHLDKVKDTQQSIVAKFWG